MIATIQNFTNPTNSLLSSNEQTANPKSTLGSKLTAVGVIAASTIGSVALASFSPMVCGAALGITGLVHLLSISKLLKEADKPQARIALALSTIAIATLSLSLCGTLLLSKASLALANPNMAASVGDFVLGAATGFSIVFSPIALWRGYQMLADADFKEKLERLAPRLRQLTQTPMGLFRKLVERISLCFSVIGPSSFLNKNTSRENITESVETSSLLHSWKTLAGLQMLIQDLELRDRNSFWRATPAQQASEVKHALVGLSDHELDEAAALLLVKTDVLIPSIFSPSEFTEVIQNNNRLLEAFKRQRNKFETELNDLAKLETRYQESKETLTKLENELNQTPDFIKSDEFLERAMAACLQFEEAGEKIFLLNNHHKGWETIRSLGIESLRSDNFFDLMNSSQERLSNLKRDCIADQSGIYSKIITALSNS